MDEMKFNISYMRSDDDPPFDAWENVPGEMEISLRCLSCGEKIYLQKRELPKTVKCKQCGKEITFTVSDVVASI